MLGRSRKGKAGAADEVFGKHRKYKIRWTPTARSVELLNHEIQHNNKPWEIHLLPEADHNLVAYKELDGRKVLSHFSQAFLLDEALWLKQIFEESKTADVH